jgi:SAM-dependent methyltransferase
VLGGRLRVLRRAVESLAMDDYEPSTYGDSIAEVYDDLYEELFIVDDAADALAELAGDGPALELAIGTGRVALPLAQRGIEVHGIDASEAMVAKLREKPGGDAIPVTIGNFADVGIEGKYSLIFIVFNTFFALTSQDAQVRCFENVALHLEPRGVFVIEAFFPDPARFDRNQRIQVDKVLRDEVHIEATRNDPVSQTSETQHVVIGPDGIKFYPAFLRYSWPSELDLMARLAGLRLKQRWANWQRAPFDSSSKFHISIYEKPVA